MKPKIKIGVADFRLGSLEKKYVLDCLNKNRLSIGKYTKEFEDKFAKLHGCRYSVFCNSGTSALQVSFHALKRKHNWPDGAQIIVPAMTFVATINTILQNNLVPVFADIEPDYFGMDAGKLEDRLTEKSAAIVPVHLFGQPADMDPIVNFAKKHKLTVLEDSCETMFALYNGKTVGSFGEIACFSTNSAHFLATGTGGLILTNSEELYHICRSLVNHGRDDIYITIDDDDTADDKKLVQIIEKRFEFTDVGYSYRPTELEAALGLGQLSRWRKIINPRKINAGKLTKGLSNLSNYLQLPKTRPNSDHSFMVYPIVVRNPKIRVRDLVYFLEKKGIETRFLLPTLSQPIYKKLFGDIEDKFPVAKYVSSHGFYIGCHQELEKRDLDYILTVFGDFFKKHKR